MYFIRKLLDFSRPAIISVDYTAILIEDKKLLLLSWQLKRYNRLTIAPLRKNYGREGAVILKLLPDTEQVTLTISSFWRKRKIHLTFKTLALDAITAKRLMQELHPVKMPAIVFETPRVRISPGAIKMQVPRVNRLQPGLKKEITVSIQPFAVELITETFKYKTNPTA